MTDAPFESAWDEARHWEIDEAIRQALSPEERAPLATA